MNYTVRRVEQVATDFRQSTEYTYLGNTTQNSGLPESFLAQLKEVTRGHIGRSADNSRRLGTRTQKARWQELVLGFKSIYQAGYALADPTNIRQKHIHAMCADMERRGLSGSAIQIRVSMFRIFCSWIGKQNMILPAENYVSNPATVVRVCGAQRDKGWDTSTINYTEILQAAQEVDSRLAAIIGLAHHFGLRAREALMFRPMIDDVGAYLSITQGTKGGRPRVVPVETEAQREYLSTVVQPFAKGAASMCWPDRTAEQGYHHFYYLLRRRLGVTRAAYNTTFHGLRHDYVNTKLEKAGYQSPVKGGDHRQQMKDNPETVLVARMTTMAAVGHARTSITTAYSGPARSTQKSQTKS